MSHRIELFSRIKPSIHHFFILGMVVAFTGCAAGGPKPTASLEDVVARESATKQETRELNDKLFASVAGAPQPQDYLIGEGDLLQVVILEAEELKTEARVSARGTVTLPLLGPVEVKGLTAHEAEQKIEDAYRKKYIEDPHVSLFVKEQQGGKITILGAVESPGTYDYFARQPILSVLAMGGGLSEKAGRMVQVSRRGPDPARPSTFLIDLDELVTKGQAHLNLEIQGGDVIFVPEAGTIYVDGAVRQPGSYPIKQSMNVQEAIVAAGGFSSIADEGNIKLLHYTGDGKREILQLSRQDIQGTAANRLEVQDRDVIFVETNKLEALIYGLRLNVLMGLVGVGYTPPSQ